MYIGPWQEYRLAQIQGDAIQRLRREWEDQLRGELPESDDARIRELMQPLVAKLPALLLAAKPSTRPKRRGSVAGAAVAPSNATSTRPSSAAPTDSLRTQSRRSERPNEAVESTSSRARPSKPTSNQETHEDASVARDRPTLVPRAPTRNKPKKPSSAPLTALEQVQKRKKMFASWIKRASSSDNSPNANARPSGAATASTAAADASEDDLDDSLDEEEVNSFLHWTDTLACPTDLDDSLMFDE